MMEYSKKENNDPDTVSKENIKITKFKPEDVKKYDRFGNNVKFKHLSEDISLDEINLTVQTRKYTMSGPIIRVIEMLINEINCCVESNEKKSKKIKILTKKEKMFTESAMDKNEF